MASVTDPQVTATLRRAVQQAILAPSVHNTQPWRFILGPNALDVQADRGRQLHTLDPTGRELLISCGAALFNARVAVAAAGYHATVDRFPDPDQPDLLARCSVGGHRATAAGIGALDSFILKRQTNRRRFADELVPANVVDDLAAAAAADGAQLVAITRPEHRLAAARLSQLADREQTLDPGYRAELRAWTTNDPHRRDGVPALAVPHVDTGTGDDLPIRDFDTHGIGWLPVDTHASADQCLLLLGTADDDPSAWLGAGEALEHVLLEITRHGYAASPLTQVIEVPETRRELREQLRLTMHPHVLLRVGRAAVTPASRRRSVRDVLTERE